MSMTSHILIVDDDTALLEALPETIRSRMTNISVDIAESGRKALALIADVDYDAIVTDIKMPELDGLGLLERVRELRPDTPTLLITGHGERDLAIRALRGGAYDFIEKPIDRDHFIASLCRAVHARRLKRQVDEQSQALARHAGELEEMVQARTRELVEANAAKDEFLKARDHALAVAQRAHERLAFLAEATRILVTSLDPTETLSRLARFLVPTLADYCIISMTIKGGVSRRIATMHADPERMELLHSLSERITPDKLSADHPIVKAQEMDRAVWYNDLAQAAESLSRSYFEAHQALEAESVVIVPLAVHGRSLGVMTLVRIRSRGGHRQEDVDMMEELARRAALAVANARLYSDAQDANRLKDEFLATVSHELRTPLTAMLGWAQMLQGGTLDEDTARRAIASIERNAKFQAHLIEDLLDISRISTGKLRLDTRPVELAHVIEASLDSVRPAADAKNIRLRRALDWKAGLISGDPDRLQQVVWNLLSNAIKFTPRGGLVEVVLERKDSQVQVAVTDTGQGISPEFLPYMFDLFRQGDSSITRSHGGLGLGLAIVKHMVEMHGGTVEATSAGEGQGATFAVTFPIVGGRMTSEGSVDGVLLPAGAHDSELSPIPELTGLSVLVVDDEPETRELLIEILSKCGADVRASGSARDALETLKHWKADVLVSDIGMPGEDGYELIRQVRAMDPQQGGRIPAVALTAYARGEDRLRALSAGFQMHVAKPVEPAELAAVVASFAWQAGKGRGRQPV
ncbi:MAG TPA: response regulator [Nitrospiraceae bacterium]|nr:response regulator [Nitrospiraceae bacterium]